MPWTYETRSNDDWERRINQSGSNRERWIKDGYRLYQPLRDENHIRLLPPNFGKYATRPDGTRRPPPHWGMDVFIHWRMGPGKAHLVCPYHTNPSGYTEDEFERKPCPLCAELARQERAGNETLIREYRPSKRVLVFMLNMKDPAAGPIAWGMPYTLDRKIAKKCQIRGTGKWKVIDHPEQGYDIFFDRIEGQKQFPDYDNVDFAQESSPIPEMYADWVAQNALPDAIVIRTADQIQRIWDGTDRGDAEDESNANASKLRSEPPRDPREDIARARAAELASEPQPQARPADTSAVRRPRTPASPNGSDKEASAAKSEEPPFDPTPSPAAGKNVDAEEFKSRFVRRRSSQ
jgi:hypothetical protein